MVPPPTLNPEQRDVDSVMNHPSLSLNWAQRFIHLQGNVEPLPSGKNFLLPLDHQTKDGKEEAASEGLTSSSWRAMDSRKQEDLLPSSGIPRATFTSW